jgi:hypothetical protein
MNKLTHAFPPVLNPSVTFPIILRKNSLIAEQGKHNIAITS